MDLLQASDGFNNKDLNVNFKFNNVYLQTDTSDSRQHSQQRKYCANSEVQSYV